MKFNSLLDTPDLALGFYQYAIFSNGEKKYLHLRIEESSINEKGEENSLVANELKAYGKLINAKSYTIFHVASENSEPVLINTVDIDIS